MTQPKANIYKFCQLKMFHNDGNLGLRHRKHVIRLCPKKNPFARIHWSSFLRKGRKKNVPLQVALNFWRKITSPQFYLSSTEKMVTIRVTHSWMSNNLNRFFFLLHEYQQHRGEKSTSIVIIRVAMHLDRDSEVLVHFYLLPIWNGVEVQTAHRRERRMQKEKKTEATKSNSD